MTKLAIVIPCYNEEKVLETSYKKLKKCCLDMIAKKMIHADSQLCFVDDGSNDRTWQIIETLSHSDKMVAGIKLAHNTGHQNALLAGMYAADGDAVLTIDVDLQDDIGVIEQMVINHQNGDEIVFGVRKERQVDSIFKRRSAQFFYSFMRWMGAELIHNHADFRLMSAKAVACLSMFREKNIFLRGVIPLIGFQSSCIYYNRQEREAGESKYPLKRMLAFAWDGITSFSIGPLRLISSLGISLSVVALILAIWVLWVKFIVNNAVPGWTSVLLPTLFFSGLQLLSLGIVGEYIGKIYGEIKDRPRFFIEKKLNITHGHNLDGRLDLSEYKQQHQFHVTPLDTGASSSQITRRSA